MPSRHCQIADCSLSTGMIFILLLAASFIIIGPAQTNASLLANAICLPASIAFNKGKSAQEPLIANNISSISAISARASRPSSPTKSLVLDLSLAFSSLLAAVSLTQTNRG